MRKLAINTNTPLTGSLNKLKRELIFKKFLNHSFSERICPLSLYKYLSNRPEKFYCKDSFSKQYFFINNPSIKEQINNLISSNKLILDRALKLLNNINKKSWHDIKYPSDETFFFRHCENNLNPNYLLLVEGVLGNLVFINAIVSRIGRGKSGDGLNIFNRFEEIKRTELAFISDSYCNTTRNSIAHGSVKYSHRYIEFEDTTTTIKNPHSEYIERFDTLLDVCNGLALAYKIYFFENISTVEIPKQVLLEELYIQTEAPWWHIQGCIESEAIKNRSQLNIFIEPRTRDLNKVRLSSMITAILAENYASGYDRYFLSFSSSIGYQGFAAFDGLALLNKRENKVDKWSEYTGVLEDNLIFWATFIKFPNLFYRIHTYYLSLALYIKTQKLQHIIDQGIEIHSRNSNIHKNGWRVVLHSDVVFESENQITVNDIKNKSSKIISIALKEARRNQPWYSIVKYLPLGYTRILVFERDFRCRALSGSGLRKELIGTVQLQRITRIKSPDIAGSTTENVGGIRYAWNRAWLQEKHF